MNYRKMYWQAKDGRRVRIQDMTDEHIVNTINFLVRKSRQILIHPDEDDGEFEDGLHDLVQENIFKALAHEAALRKIWDEVHCLEEVENAIANVAAENAAGKAIKDYLFRPSPADPDSDDDMQIEFDNLGDVFGPIYDSDDIPHQVSPTAYYPLLGCYGINHPDYKGK